MLYTTYYIIPSRIFILWFLIYEKIKCYLLKLFVILYLQIIFCFSKYYFRILIFHNSSNKRCFLWPINKKEEWSIRLWKLRRIKYCVQNIDKHPCVSNFTFRKTRASSDLPVQPAMSEIWRRTSLHSLLLFFSISIQYLSGSSRFPIYL